MKKMDYVSMNLFQKLIYKFKAFFVGLFSGLVAFFRNLPSKIGNFFKAIGRTLKGAILTFKEGDIKTRFSFVIMGFSNLVRGQIIKGLLFLVSEVLFIFYMISSGAMNIEGLVSLGTITQHIEAKEGQVPQLVPGDNSMLILLFGVLSAVVVIFFIRLYFMNLSSAIGAQRVQNREGKLPSFREELKDYRDSRFHITLLTFPVVGVLALTLLPQLFMILISFTNFDSTHQPPGNLFHWIGIANFKTVLASGESIGKTFWPVLGWTIIWAILSTLSNYILGMLLAILINKKGIKFKKVFRTIFILTIAIPNFVSLLVMRNMLDINGPINGFLMHSGFIKDALPFLTDATWARATVLIVNLWIGIPYTMLITTGILMNIPEDLYEAAKIDGASAIAMYMKITLPYVLFVTAPYLITQFIGNFNNFNVIFLLTGGGPSTLTYYQAGKTDLLITWLFNLTSKTNDISFASTIGVIVYALSIVFALTAYRNTAAYKNEEAFQ
jgi:arabinogalactan oligomer / maltooligosaccharide transport system permease protein